MDEQDRDEALINPHSDPTSRRAYALIFNGLSDGLFGEDHRMTLSERSRISQAIYESLRTGGLELRFVDGLEMLRLADIWVGSDDSR